MKLSVMSYTLARQVKDQSKFDIPAMCRLANELQIDGIDMVTTYGQKPAELRRILDGFGVKTVCHTIMSDLNHADAAGRRAGVSAIQQGVEDAVALGTDKIMVVTPGRGDVPRDVTRRNYIAGLKEGLAFAQKAKITVTVENFPGAASPFVTAADFIEARAEIPSLRLTFDSGNTFTGEDPAESFRQCAPYVVHAHFKDWDIVQGNAGMLGLDGRRYASARIGEGVLDHRSTLAAMKKAGYKGYINIEYEGDKYKADDATRRAARYLREIIAGLN